MEPQFSIRPSNSSATYRLSAAIGEADGFAQLGDIYSTAVASSADTILVDCGKVEWIDAHLAAGYAAIVQLLKVRRQNLTFVNMIPSVRGIFAHHGIMGFRPPTVKKSVIPVTCFTPGQSKRFAQYTQEHFTRLPIPQMSKAVQEKFFEGIDELFSNAELHSKTKLGIFACGQFFPRKDKLDFSIVDLGIGFEYGINSTTNLNLSPHAAIDWAMTGTNTTRLGDIPGGLGLKILKDFVCLNKGRLTIISYGGFWCLSPKGILQNLMRTSFPGTAVILEINTADRNSYYMEEEPNEWSPSP